MKLYSIKLRLGGSVANELRKVNVTAAEIEVLKSLHGSDSVTDVVELEDVKRSHREERARIYGIYANPASNMPEAVAKKMIELRNLLGHDSLPLPEEIVAPIDPAVEEAPPPKAKKERAPAFAE